MTVPAEVREHWREARASARNDGLVPALTLLSRALSPGAPPRGPRGHAVVPRELLEEYRDLAEPDTPDPLPGLAVLPPEPGPRPRPAPDPQLWGTGLAWLRLGHSERLRAACVAYLAARTVEGTSLLLQQMVKGALADALIEQLEIAGVLDELAGPDRPDDPFLSCHPLDARALTRLQAQITEVDRALLRLLGAHGFTAEGPGRDAHASELLADVHCGWPGAAEPCTPDGGGHVDGDRHHALHGIEHGIEHRTGHATHQGADHGSDRGPDHATDRRATGIDG
ncbi:hypothetical protein AB0O91_11365 [Kitasatospora sp. NPDC089797]|uniref:hypothetical protein n=1 Tax=Kitasatospora sp. NPDC089797 TaxID=3155298 RepID=UPI003423E393